MFAEVYERIKKATGKKTQVEIAEILGIRQSSISDAKRRGKIPAEWVLTLHQKLRINPDWLLYGIGSILVEQITIEDEAQKMVLQSMKESVGKLRQTLSMAHHYSVHLDMLLSRINQKGE